jgi:DNA-binding IclR family transcriptional regulator
MVLHDELDLEQGMRNLIEFTPLSVRDHTDLTIYEDDMEDEVREERKLSDHVDSQVLSSGVEEMGLPMGHNNHHAVLQVLVPNEQRRFYEKVLLPKIFQKLKTVQGFR